MTDPSPGPGELLLRVTACGLCGSDLKARAAMPEGTIMGHEFCGEVAGVGTGTTGWREGDSAAVLPVLACGRCEWCASGQAAHCASARMIGLGGSEGGFAELAVVTPPPRSGSRRAWTRSTARSWSRSPWACTASALDPSPLLSRRLDLSLVNDAFDDLARTATAGKILLTP